MMNYQVKMFFLILLSLVVVSAQVPECTITSIDQILPVLEQCKVIIVNDLNVPSGKILELNLKEGSLLTFAGRITFDVKYQDHTPLVKITGKDFTVSSTKDALLDGQGAEYWDGKGGKGRRKPILLEIESQNSTFTNLNLLNCPQTCVKILKSHNVFLSGWNVDVSEGFKNDSGVDTHGFTIANSSEITIEESNIVNQGDCIAVNQGSNLYFQKITCKGSQGLTVRPEWDEDNFIRNVTFKNCTVIEGVTGVRVVTSPHQAQGDISDVVYDNIHVTGILFRGIDVRQDLDDEGRPADNVKIRELNVSDIKGNMTDKYVRAVYIWTGTDNCSDWTWSDINIEKAEVENACNCLPSGWSCW